MKYAHRSLGHDRRRNHPLSLLLIVAHVQRRRTPAAARRVRPTGGRVAPALPSAGRSAVACAWESGGEREAPPLSPPDPRAQATPVGRTRCAATGVRRSGGERDARRRECDF
ncbi:hypothetical protein AXF42_Ash016719 [Apostasia shenzhenica]|uniref:Uncharacterized protein n=1 Tax=Apostasia shenzhenica TaxID=1088818 RepID=A0A2I0AQ37_9ASPA|nr:hypothetical protein AXF42_Ash016719 [Apostasia shenzhenica]